MHCKLCKFHSINISFAKEDKLFYFFKTNKSNQFFTDRTLVLTKWFFSLTTLFSSRFFSSSWPARFKWRTQLLVGVYFSCTYTKLVKCQPWDWKYHQFHPRDCTLVY